MEKTAKAVASALRILGIIQILTSLCGAAVILLSVKYGYIEAAGKEIMMDARAIVMIALFLMFLVAAAGALSLLKIQWGWFFSFAVATVVLVMAFLMGPGSIPITKWSFIGLMILSLINWATAVVYYFHDLYT